MREPCLSSLLPLCYVLMESVNSDSMEVNTAGRYNSRCLDCASSTRSSPCTSTRTSVSTYPVENSDYGVVAWYLRDIVLICQAVRNFIGVTASSLVNFSSWNESDVNVTMSYWIEDNNRSM